MQRQPSEQPSSFLANEPQQQSSTQEHITKQQNQFKALFVKNTILQSKQVGTNICQIMTPVICLIFTYLIKRVAEQNLQISFTFDNNFYPYKFNDFELYDTLNPNLRNKIQFYLIECQTQTGCDQSFMGVNDGQQKNRSGVLGNISITAAKTDVCLDPYNDSQNISFYNMPFFYRPANGSSANQQAFRRLNIIGRGSYQILKHHRGLDFMPDGSINYKTLNNNSLQAEIKVDDCRDLQYHRTNGISKNNQLRYIKNKLIGNTTDFTQAYGILHIMHMVSASFVKSITNQFIQAGYLLMPDTDDQNSIIDTLINSVASLVFPLGLSLLFPVFLYSIALEKQERLIQMMKMNGLKIRYYWLTFLAFNFMLCMITNFIFYFLGIVVLGTAFFVKTSWLLFAIISVGWSLAQIGMAAFFQTFLNKSRSANIIGYLISIWTSMIGSTLNIGIYQYPSQLPYLMQMFPPFGFCRIFYLMTMECSTGDCYFDLSRLNSEIQTCIVFLYIGFVFFFGLGAYLFEIIPQEFGVKRSPLFPFHSLKAMFKKKRQIDIDTTEDLQLRDYISQHQQDDFSKEQRAKVLSFRSQKEQQTIKQRFPLIINNMRKLYTKNGMKQPYPAVRSFNLGVAKNQTFGLLGPNGAGKTTLISMITGMYEPNNGNAWIGGYDIRTSIEKAQLEMGVCPQFDLVWPQLSVEEHLYFYGRLKGLPQAKLKKQVQDSIKQVKLERFATFAAKQLSGGMKRRLSVAISLVGDPQIVFLDEPSTGLDPDNRRQLWSVLSECQNKRALFITTHMMQEADTLCNRVGIITSGVLRTIQTPMKLKKVYGEGYDMVINTVREERTLVSRESLHIGIGEEENWQGAGAGDAHNNYADDYDNEQDDRLRNSLRASIQGLAHLQAGKNQRMTHTNLKIVDFMKRTFVGTYLNKCFNGYLIFKIPTIYKISDLFEAMNLVEKELGFSDISITNSSLENVFMNVVGKFDADQKKADTVKTPNIKDGNSNGDRKGGEGGYNGQHSDGYINCDYQQQSLMSSHTADGQSPKKKSSTIQKSDHHNQQCLPQSHPQQHQQPHHQHQQQPQSHNLDPPQQKKSAYQSAYQQSQAFETVGAQTFHSKANNENFDSVISKKRQSVLSGEGNGEGEDQGDHEISEQSSQDNNDDQIDQS